MDLEGGRAKMAEQRWPGKGASLLNLGLAEFAAACWCMIVGAEFSPSSVLAKNAPILHDVCYIARK